MVVLRRQPRRRKSSPKREVPIGPDGTVEGRDRHVAREGASIPIRTTATRFRPKWSTNRGARSSATARCSSPASRSRCIAWVDRGYYRVGDTIAANFAARRLDGKPVEGTGKLRLLKITYGPAPDRTPVETEVRSWSLATNAEGRAELQLKASETGQYRLSYEVTDKAEHAIEGGYSSRSSAKASTAASSASTIWKSSPTSGNTRRATKSSCRSTRTASGSTVLLFVRPSNGVYLPPQILQLAGKSTVVEIGVTQKDMPNFFVEAVTIAEGQVHTEVARNLRAAGEARAERRGHAFGARRTSRGNTRSSR